MKNVEKTQESKQFSTLKDLFGFFFPQGLRLHFKGSCTAEADRKLMPHSTLVRIGFQENTQRFCKLKPLDDTQMILIFSVVYKDDLFVFCFFALQRSRLQDVYFNDHKTRNI